MGMSVPMYPYELNEFSYWLGEIRKFDSLVRKNPYKQPQIKIESLKQRENETHPTDKTYQTNYVEGCKLYYYTFNSLSLFWLGESLQ